MLDGVRDVMSRIKNIRSRITEMKKMEKSIKNGKFSDVIKAEGNTKDSEDKVVPEKLTGKSVNGAESLINGLSSGKNASGVITPEQALLQINSGNMFNSGNLSQGTAQYQAGMLNYQSMLQAGKIPSDE